MKKDFYFFYLARPLFLILVISYSSLSNLSAQEVDCSNVGFEEGTVRGWSLTNGSVSKRDTTTVYLKEVSGTFANGHLITKIIDGNDPIITATSIPMVAPGSQYSIRIGNSKDGSRFDRIRTSFKVTPDNTLFQYKFAVVLEDPKKSHPAYRQPAFSLLITTSKGDTAGCGYYQVTAAKQIAGFENQGNLRYRNWTTGAIDLKQYVGQTLNIAVTTNDCTEGDHYGYAYFDAQCLKSEVVPSTNCFTAGSEVTLSAPEGFETYQWSTGETTRSITVKAQEGTRYSVKARPFSSLNDACNFELEYTVPPSQKTYTQTVVICEGESIKVGNSVYNSSADHIPRPAPLCDSLVITTVQVKDPVRHTQELKICEGDSILVGNSVYKASGIYTDKIPRPAPLCDSTIITTVKVMTPVRYDQTLTICQGSSVKVGNSVYSSNGTYTNVFPRPAPLCDSTVVTTVQIKVPVRHTQTFTICQGQSVTVGSSVYKTSGAYTDVLSRPAPLCDSVVITTIKVSSEVTFAQTLTICEGSSINVGSSVYKTGGSYTDRIARAGLCDSVITTTVKMAIPTAYAQTVTICEGESLAVGGSVYKASGVYTDRIPRTVPLCDSIVTTTLHIQSIKIDLPYQVLVEAGDSVLLKPVINPNGNYTFQWRPSEGLSCANCAQTWARPQASTLYELIVTDKASQCQTSAQVKVDISAECPIFVPDAFTPELSTLSPSNGINDRFVFLGGDCVINVAKFYIYDGFGEVIYREENFSIKQMQGWDGKYKECRTQDGKRIDCPAQNGAYAYRIEYEAENRKRRVKIGKVLLIR